MDVLISMTPPNGGTVGAGTVALKSDPIGPDALRIMVTGLQANTTHVVMLANSPLTGALPVYFAGEFTTDRIGQGFFSGVLEVGNAYTGENPDQITADGTAPALAGVLSRGGKNVPLDFIRIYRGAAAPGGLQTVFTLDGVQPGGAHVLSTTRPIPQEVPSAQFLYNIVALSSMKCVGLSKPVPGNGIPFLQQTCAQAAPTQTFRFLPTAPMSFQIRVSSSLKCFSVRGDAMDDNVALEQEVCRGLPGTPLQFQLTPAPAPALGYFMIMSTRSRKCLEVSGGSSVDGAPLVQMPCRPTNNASQLFRFSRVDS